MENKTKLSPVDLFLEKLLGASDEILKHEETRNWPAAAGLLVIGIANIFLSDNYHFFGQGWLFLAAIVGVLVVVIFLNRKGSHDMVHNILAWLCFLLFLFEVFNVARLLFSLPDKTVPATTLLVNAGVLWVSNVLIFAFWYWEIEGGGPMERSVLSGHDYQNESELLFPQLTLTGDRVNPKWRPDFVDYLFVAFNTSTAFSPTDTPVLSLRLKGLTMLQSLLSLVTLATLAARAVNLL